MNRVLFSISIACVAAACVEAQPSPKTQRTLAGDLPAISCDGDMGPPQKWDGQPLPAPQTETAHIFVFASADQVGTWQAVEADGDKITAFVELPEAAVSKLIAGQLLDGAPIILRKGPPICGGKGPRPLSANCFTALAYRLSADEKSGQCDDAKDGGVAEVPAAK